MKKLYLFFIPSLFIVLIDQVTKYIILNNIPVNTSIEVIKGFFNIVHVRNNGIAFGILRGNWGGVTSFILILITGIITVALIVWVMRIKDDERLLHYSLSMIIGGAIGNLIDRIRLNEVVDFLDFYIQSFHWPAFNVADSSITIGTILLAIKILF